MARVHDMHSSCIGVVCIIRLLVGVFLMFFCPFSGQLHLHVQMYSFDDVCMCIYGSFMIDWYMCM